MPVAEIATVEALLGATGADLGSGDWFEVTQEQVNQFATLTGSGQGGSGIGLRRYDRPRLLRAFVATNALQDPANTEDYNSSPRNRLLRTEQSSLSNANEDTSTSEDINEAR
jgi:hypothetical protein